MLDFLRRRSQSFVIKIVLASVILPFVLFYGYSRYSDSEVANPTTIATVNGRDIPASVYRMSYEQMMENYRKSIQGAQMPDFVQKMAEQNALRQLMQRELMVQAAEKNQLSVSERELADFIVRNFSREGEEFDPVAYRHGFLPSINSKLGINYEDYVRADLQVNNLIGTLGDVRLPWTPSGQTPTQTWEFEKVSFSEAALKSKNKLAQDQSAEKLIEAFLAPKADWKKLSKSLDLEVQKVGPLTLQERDMLQAELSLDEAVKAFKLLPGQALRLGSLNPSAATPEGNITLVRLTQKKPVKEKDKLEQKPADLEWAFLDNWMQAAFANAKIESQLSEK